MPHLGGLGRHNRKNIKPVRIKRNIFLFFREFHSSARGYMNLTANQRELVKDFNRRVKEGSVLYEFLPCLCGSNEFELLASVDKYSMLQDTILCAKCGLIQSNPRMTPEEYANYYSSDFYRKCYESENYLNIYKDKYTINEGRHIFDEINKIKKIAPGVSVLELGAGGGWNLLVFKEAGANVFGLDYSPSLVSMGRQYGINIQQGSIKEITGEFDVIIINHAWEHFMDPVESLKKIIQHMKKGGLVYIAVPNIINYCLEQLQNAHTYYFDPETFNYYCCLSGLEPLAFGPAQVIHMFGIFKKAGQSAPGLSLEGHSRKIRKHLTNMMLKHYLKGCLIKMHMGKVIKIFRKHSCGL